MSTATINENHDDHAPKPYLQVFYALAILTVIEVIVGQAMDTSEVKVFFLLVLAVAKAAGVAAVFMHVAYEKDPKLILTFAFIAPLIGAIVLGSVIWADFRL